VRSEAASGDAPISILLFHLALRASSFFDFPNFQIAKVASREVQKKRTFIAERPLKLKIGRAD
jgi:hypothetical protein